MAVVARRSDPSLIVMRDRVHSREVASQITPAPLTVESCKVVTATQDRSASVDHAAVNPSFPFLFLHRDRSLPAGALITTTINPCIHFLPCVPIPSIHYFHIHPLLFTQHQIHYHPPLFPCPLSHASGLLSTPH